MLTLGAYYKYSSTAFVTFRTRMAETIAYQMLLTNDMMEISHAPNPHDGMYMRVCVSIGGSVCVCLCEGEMCVCVCVCVCVRGRCVCACACVCDMRCTCVCISNWLCVSPYALYYICVCASTCVCLPLLPSNLHLSHHSTLFFLFFSQLFGRMWRFLKVKSQCVITSPMSDSL